MSALANAGIRKRLVSNQRMVIFILQNSVIHLNNPNHAVLFTYGARTSAK